MTNKEYLSKEEASTRDEWKSADADGRYRKSGIIYWNHQPGKNYFMANGAGDTDMKTDILMSEIAKLIVNNKTRVVQLLNDSGVKTSSGITISSLSDKVAKALYGNIKFAEAIAAEIVQSGTKLNADGTTTPAKPKKSFSDILAEVSTTGKNLADAAKNVKDLIGNVFGGKNKNESQATTSQENLKSQTEAVNKINDSGIGAAGYILIALGISTAIGLTVYFIRRK